MLEQGTLLPEKIDKPRATVRDLTAVSQVLRPGYTGLYAHARQLQQN